jgi:methylenetetrahydrofolate dehydrogenase (NADP+) / methenyltetrahydrofolate cyclohydrolase
MFPPHSGVDDLGKDSEFAMTAQVIDGRKIAETLRTEVARDISELASNGITCRLATVSVGHDDGATRYERRVAATAAHLGVAHCHVAIDADASPGDVVDAITALNDDPAISAILVLRPLPDHIDEAEVFRSVSPLKDVEGVHPENLGLLALGNPRFVSPTAASAFHVLDEWIDQSGVERDDFYHDSLIVVVGRSNNVGKPAMLLALQRQAALESVDEWASRNGQLGWHTRRADVLIVAAGCPELIHAEHVREGTIVLDVGVNAVRDAGGTRIVGDVDFAQVCSRARALTPVPGGIGPLTDLWLLRNTGAAARLNHDPARILT